MHGSSACVPSLRRMLQSGRPGRTLESNISYLSVVSAFQTIRMRPWVHDSGSCYARVNFAKGSEADPSQKSWYRYLHTRPEQSAARKALQLVSNTRVAVRLPTYAVSVSGMLLVRILQGLHISWESLWQQQTSLFWQQTNFSLHWLCKSPTFCSRQPLATQHIISQRDSTHWNNDDWISTHCSFFDLQYGEDLEQGGWDLQNESLFSLVQLMLFWILFFKWSLFKQYFKEF